jgi:hypothetical protein
MKKIMKQFAVLVPKDSDLENFLSISSNEYDSEYLKYLIHSVITGLSRIIEQPYSEYQNHTPLTEKYISISSKKDVLTDNKKHIKHRDLLCMNKIDISRRISRTTYTDQPISVLYKRNYKKGDYPYGFRLNPRFTNKRLKVHSIENCTLIDKIKKHYSCMPPIVNSGKYKFLKKYFDTPQLKINLDGAIQLCEIRYTEHKSYGKYLNEMVQINDLYNGTFRIYYKSETDGRLHTNITRLPKVYRRYLSYNNSALVEVDLSNSIVFFLSMILNNKLDNKLISITNPILLMFVNSLLGLDIKEIELMQDKSINGTFYDDFIPEYEKEYKTDTIKIMFEKENDDKFTGSEKQIRKVIKKRLLAMIFAKTKDYKIEQKIFKTKYSSILNNINKFKDDFGYEKLSHLLFQMEAHFMINEAARSFNSKHWRKAPLFTLHDCLITTSKYSEELKDCMRKTFENLIGISPNMTNKEWI